MKKYNELQASIFIDIDDTLTTDFGKTFFNNAIEKIKELSEKTNIILWSQQGMSYCIEIMQKTQLENYITMCIPKPDMIIDDLNFNQFAKTKIIKTKNDWDFKLELTGDWVDDIEIIREN